MIPQLDLFAEPGNVILQLRSGGIHRPPRNLFMGDGVSSSKNENLRRIVLRWPTGVMDWFDI
jgi:hypothetical protein